MGIVRLHGGRPATFLDVGGGRPRNRRRPRRGRPLGALDFVAVLDRFEADPKTDAVVLIGEIGGPDESRAAAVIGGRMRKPIVAFVAAVSAPAGTRTGHAGAIVSGGADETAAARAEVLRRAGVHVVENPAVPGRTVAAGIGRGGLP